MKKQNVNKKSKEALREFKQDQELRNHNSLVIAFNRLVNNEPINVKKGTRLTVVSVAKEAGVSRSTVYLHIDIIEKISAYKANPSGSDFKRNKSIRDAAVAKKEKIKGFVDQLKIDKHNLAQENFKLTLELKEANDRISELRKNRGVLKVVPISSTDTI